MPFNPEKIPTLPQGTPEDAEKRMAGKMAGKRGEGFGETIMGPETTEERKKEQAEDTKEKSVEAKRETQLNIIRDWAESESFKEGVDFKIISSITEITEEKDTTAPHEIDRLYLAFRREHFGKFTAFFEKIYPSEMRERNVRRPWSSEVTLNYSWGGRYCVAGESGLAIDSAPVESVDPPLCKPEHNKFKRFFQEKYGFELPSAEELDEIMIKMSEFLSWYEDTLNKLKTAQKESTEPWEYQHPIDQLEYAVIILRDANILRQLKEKPGILEGPGDHKAVQETRKSLTERHRLEELPEEFSYIRDKIRHYNDLTYNADDWIDLESIKRLLGDKYELPEEKGSRIDRIYEDYYGFDRKNFEIACREFSEALFSSRPEK